MLRRRGPPGKFAATLESHGACHYRRPTVTFRDLRRLAAHRALVPVWALLLALLVLLPRLSTPGLSEPQEMKVADQAATRADRTLAKPASDARAAVAAGSWKPPAARGDCPKAAPDDDGARDLTPVLAAIGFDRFGHDEGDLRLLLALLGLASALAVYGIGARLATPRAGLLATIILLSFPLTVLQARQLTSEIGTAAGATLVVYGLVAAARPARWPWAIPDLLLSALAVVVGGAIAFFGGGTFLGWLPPLAAIALAGGLGAAFVVALARVGGQALLHAVRALSPRRTIGRLRPLRQSARLSARDAAVTAIALLATVAAIAVAVVLVAQIYDVQTMAPGTREVFTHSFVPRECWSDALGGVWRAHDDARSTYDSMFEQIAFGTFPWGILAPVALLGLASGLAGESRREAGRITLAWAAVAWLTGSVFERKVGFTIYAGFPALALALGVWLDGLLDKRHALDAPQADPVRLQHLIASSLVAGLWAFLAMPTLAKDLSTFPERLTSLLVGGDAIKYPAVRLLGAPLKGWMLVLSLLTGTAFGCGMWFWRPRHLPQHPVARVVGRWGIVVAIALAAITGLFWAQGWQPTLSRALSSKHVFSVFRELRREGDLLGVMGDMGNAPRYYAGGASQPVRSREELIAFLDRPERVFAMAPASELCAIHRAFAGKPYFVLDDSNAKFLLLSNQVTGARDRNPLATTILRSEPPGIQHRFSATWDDRIELIGYTLPRSIELRSTFAMTLYFHVKKPVAGSWKVFAHFDGRGLRFQGDHDPIRGRCATSYWQEGDYIVDTFSVTAGDLTFEGGNYQVRVGFFTGTNPNWKNMKVTQAPPGAKDDADRVLLGTIAVQ